MKALLIKDFYLMIKTCKMFFIMILAFFAMGIFIPERSAIYLYAVIFIGMLSHSLLAIEERDGSDKYYLICPVSKKQIVAEKYVFSAIMVTVMITAIAVLELIKNTNMSAILFILSLAIALGLIFPSISMPIMFRFGYAKGKNTLYVPWRSTRYMRCFFCKCEYFFCRYAWACGERFSAADFNFRIRCDICIVLFDFR